MDDERNIVIDLWSECVAVASLQPSLLVQTYLNRRLGRVCEEKIGQDILGEVGWTGWGRGREVGGSGG